MTYLQFHLVFTLPLLGVLGLLSLRVVRRGEPLAGALSRSNRVALGALLTHVLIALVYTTPWDNYLVFRQVWGYPEGRVLFTLGYVPVEEYLFFVVQTLLAGLVLFMLLRWRRAWAVARPLDARLARRLRVGGAVISLVVAAAGLLLLQTAWGTYLGLILVWAGPVLALLWGFAGDWLVARWRLTLAAIFMPTLYLWIADRIAIGLEIWWINPELTTGFKPLGLPIEEAVFFLLTNTFVVFGLTAMLEPHALERLGKIRGVRAPWRPVFVLWALSMIPTPLFPAAFALLAYVSTTLLALGVFGYALARYGRRAFLLFTVAFGFGLGVEWLGSATGFPFGAYRYTAPGPTLFGVPLLVPLGWFAFTLIAIAVSPARTKVWVAPLALVAWDLGLDPLMVDKGFWEFASGAYYGVPLSNFLGWYGCGLVLVWLLCRLEPRLRTDSAPDLQMVFLAQAFLMTVGLLFFGLFGAAGVTFAAMGLVSLNVWRPRVQQERARGFR